METMSYREKKRKSLKGPIVGLTMFLTVGTGIITYAITHEKEPVVIGNNGSLFTGEIPVVQEADALVNLTKEDLSDLFKIKINYAADTSNAKIKCDMSIPNVYIEGEEFKDFNSTINDKFTSSFEGFKETMSSVEHNFTYRVYYREETNIVDDKGILSLIVTEKMIDDASSVESLKKRYTYNIDITNGEVIKQQDVVIDLLGSNYKDAIKASISKYLDENDILEKEHYKYAYTGLENFYIEDGKLHFLFNSGEIVDKKYGILDITIEKLVAHKNNEQVDVYDE